MYDDDDDDDGGKSGGLLMLLRVVSRLPIFALFWSTLRNSNNESMPLEVVGAGGGKYSGTDAGVAIKVGGNTASAATPGDRVATAVAISL